jgi:hypothetical protein
MSHVAKITLQITDLDALDAACQELGLTLVRNQTSYKWFGTHVGDYPLPDGFLKGDLGRCEHAIQVPGTTWEIGVARARGHQHYTLLFDFYGSQGQPIANAIGGNDGTKLKRAYATHAAIQQAKRQGWTYTRREQNGKTKLTLHVP